MSTSLIVRATWAAFWCALLCLVVCSTWVLWSESAVSERALCTAAVWAIFSFITARSVERREDLRRLIAQQAAQEKAQIAAYDAARQAQAQAELEKQQQVESTDAQASVSVAPAYKVQPPTPRVAPSGAGGR